MTDPRGPYIFTHTGKRFHFMDPQPADICLEDIAHSLSNLCRYTGHGKFYSVAEHSVYVMRYVLRKHPIASIGLLQSALLHDATEAYVGDMSKPLKTLLPAYDEIEDKAARAIAKRFWVDTTDPRIKHADTVLLATELPIVINYHETTGGAFEWLPPADPHTDIMCLEPSYAKALFLRAAESVLLHA